ncbi:UNVERIFIED_CONTAM: hypothetical protein FKN15_040539 [Acipenser sinensis]
MELQEITLIPLLFSLQAETSLNAISSTDQNYLLLLALKTKHQLTNEALEDILKLLNHIGGDGTVPASKYYFEKYFSDCKGLLLSRIPCAALDSVEMESVQIKEEFSEPELVPFRVEFFELASLPIKQELCEMQCDSSQPQVSEVKAEHSELEISQTEEPLPVKQEEVLEINHIKQEPPEVEFDHMEPGKEESEDFKPNIPELERVCVREQGTGEEGSPNSMQGGGKEDGQSHSECSLAGE